jgi:FSR family fosmidomycin resistance protein-like MFS transporter
VSTVAGSAAGAWRVALAVALAHGVNDVYSAFLHPLLPRIMTELGLSITLAATLTTAAALGASLLQPVMGAAADRYGVRRFVVAGPVISAVFLSLIGFAGSFGVLVVMLTMGGLGSALFHPPAAAMAASARHGGGAGARMSLFSFGGALGYAVGPLAAVSIVGLLGLRGLAFAIIPALLLVPFLWRVLPADVGHGRAWTGTRGATAALRSLRGPLGLLFLVSSIAAFVQRVFLTLQPIAIAAEGGSEALGAVTLSVYLGAQTMGSLAGGLLADRFDRRRVLLGLTLASVPTHLLALGLPAASTGALVSTAIAGMLNMALLAPLVIMAQEASPHGAATSAGIIMGLAWAAGSIAMIGAGALGDVIGPRTAAIACMPVLLIASGATLHPALRPFRSAVTARAHAGFADSP